MAKVQEAKKNIDYVLEQDALDMRSRNNMHWCRQCKNGRNQDSKSMTGLRVFFVPFPNIKIDCIKEMGKL